MADDVEAGIDVARRIGFLRETNFGTTFEVISKPNPNNLAYTSHALPLHTDLANQELPPGFQFLHCLANEAEGGGSTFVTASRLRTISPGSIRRPSGSLPRRRCPFAFTTRTTTSAAITR